MEEFDIKDNLSTVQVREDDARTDALGDMPKWEEMDYKSIILLSYYWKKNEHGRWIPRPCEWKDGNSSINHNYQPGDDKMTIAVRRMAANQKSLLKCGLTDEIINLITPNMDVDEAIGVALKAKRAAYAAECNVRRQELKSLQKEANIQMAEVRAKLTMNELQEKTKVFAIKIRDASPDFERRKFHVNRGVAMALELCGVKENKPIATFVNRYCWGIITGKLTKTAEEDAEKKIQSFPALEACMERYLEALNSATEAEDKENHREEPAY